jgi:thiaminase/transcriptional activator TenA
LEDFIDGYATDSELIRHTYRYAMTCELAFFTAAWQGPVPLSP